MKTVKQSSTKVAVNAYGRPEQNNGFANYGHSMFCSRNLNVTSHHLLRSARDFFNNRVTKYWNQLPIHVRNSTSINAFKAPLDLFKWLNPIRLLDSENLLEEVFNRIIDKSEHVNYLLANRDVAMQQNILF